MGKGELDMRDREPHYSSLVPSRSIASGSGAAIVAGRAGFFGARLAAFFAGVFAAALPLAALPALAFLAPLAFLPSLAFLPFPPPGPSCESSAVALSRMVDNCFL